MNPWTSSYKSHQGNIGLGMAIAYYTSHCIQISIPLNDTQKYDLIIDDKNVLKRVSIKTTQYKSKSDYFSVELHNTGGASGKSRVVKFDNSTCDIVFIVTSEMDMYIIPANKIEVRHSLTLNKTWDKYKIQSGASALRETWDVDAG